MDGIQVTLLGASDMQTVSPIYVGLYTLLSKRTVISIGD